MAVVMGTAGHIDHGKTSLVRALTGIDTDRLEEEQRRGITIELGFAHLDLPTGGTGDGAKTERLGIVDVPGHEKFVKNMAAGAACIDFVLLVVAADEGVMPQTREHLDICTLLGIKSGLVALTKADAVDEELLELAQEDVASFLEGTFLEGAPVLPVSSVEGPEGRGLAELRDAIAAMASQLTEQPRADLFRLPIDRVFSLKGHGTVITGTMIAGQIATGEEVQAYPTGTRTKVRSLQSHGESVEVAPPGRRTAVNLQGIGVEDVHRGDVLARTGELFPSHAWDVELTVLESSPRALRHRTEIHFHHGSREVLARLYFKGIDRAQPGDTVLCQVRFPEPMVGVYGDRCVVRAFSPLRTVAGGRIVNPHGRRYRANSAQGALVRDILSAQGDAAVNTLVDRQLALAGTEGLSQAQLRTMTPLSADALAALLGEMAASNQTVLFDKESRGWLHGPLVTQLCETAEKFLADYHKAERLSPGLPRAALASAWDKGLSPKLVSFLIEHMSKSGRAVAEQDIIRLPSHSATLTEAQEIVRDKLRKAYAGYGLTPPNLVEVLEEHGIGDRQAPPILRLLSQGGELVKVTDAQYFSVEAMNGLKKTLRDWFETNEEMGLPDFKELTGLTRKYIIPLLEHLDTERFLLRVGDKRRLRSRTAE